MSKDYGAAEKNGKETRGSLRLSAKDKLWVILAVVAIVVGFIIAVFYDL
jgi:hypothetical protein